MERMLDVNDVAGFLHVSRNTAKKLMEQMHPVDVSASPAKHQYRVLQAELDAWIRRRQTINVDAEPQKRRKPKVSTASSYMDEYGRPYIRKNGKLVPMAKPPERIAKIV